MSKNMFNFESVFSDKEKDELVNSLTNNLSDFIKGMYDFCKKIELVDENPDASVGTIKDVLDGFFDELSKDEESTENIVEKQVVTDNKDEYGNYIAHDGTPCQPVNPYNDDECKQQVVTDNKDSNGNYIAHDGTPCQPADPYEKKGNLADSLKKYYDDSAKTYNDEVDAFVAGVISQASPKEKGGLITKEGDILKMEFPIYSVLEYPAYKNCIDTIIEKAPDLICKKTGFSKVEMYNKYTNNITIIFKF